MPPGPEVESCLTPLDGGWGWMVVVGAFISIGFSYAMPKALTVFFNEIQEEFLISYSDIAWVTSIMLAAMYAGGPVSSLLVNRFGSRPVAIVGGLLCGGAMVIASFGSSIIHLYICIGVIGGCGLSFNLNASLTIISKYFLAKRPLANGIAMAGSPVFLCFLAPLSQYLLTNFGWRGSLLILGGMLFNCCVAGSLMRPAVLSANPSMGAPQKVVEQADNYNTKLKESCMKNVYKLLDFSLLKDRGFIIYLIGNLLFFFGAYAPITFLAAYAVSQGIEEYSAAYLLSIMGFVDMFARPGTGLVASTKWIRPRIQYFLSCAMIFTGVTHLLCPLGSGYVFLAIYVALFGIGFGMVFALIFECLMELMGPQRFSSAVGLVTIIECCPMLLGPPTAGALVDVFGHYRYLFIMCGTVIVAGGVFLFVMNIYNNHMLEKERAAKDTDQNCTTKDNQDPEKAVEVQLEARQQPPEAAAEQTEPEAGDGTTAQGEQMKTSEDDPRPENAVTASKS
ncbi:monocarboxylate transporter 2-like [Centroberyx gerrardi]|uniref:monocarboxylate transporter 2-like n=1 Tax=Centroberyx gerrardi TaxID=166262 RepID=UPI003AABFE9A